MAYVDWMYLDLLILAASAFSHIAPSFALKSHHHPSCLHLFFPSSFHPLQPNYFCIPPYARRNLRVTYFVPHCHLTIAFPYCDFFIGYVLGHPSKQVDAIIPTGTPNDPRVLAANIRSHTKCPSRQRSWLDLFSIDSGDSVQHIGESWSLILPAKVGAPCLEIRFFARYGFKMNPDLGNTTAEKIIERHLAREREIFLGGHDQICNEHLARVLSTWQEHNMKMFYMFYQM